jgi:hypothetical protein
MSKKKRGGPPRRYFGVILRYVWGLCAFLPALPMSLAAQERQQQDQRPAADRPVGTARHRHPRPQRPGIRRADRGMSSPTTTSSLRRTSSFGGLFYMSTGSINDCDAACFDQLRATAMVTSETNPNWRREVLRQLDVARSEGEWQAYRHDVYRAHNKVCQFTFDKQDELRRSGASFRPRAPADCDHRKV